MTQSIHDTVREHYAAAARQVLAVDARPQLPVADCCGTGDPTSACGCGDEMANQFGGGLYDALQLAELPGAAILASLGCGNPVAVAELHEGETVLDLGSGDVVISNCVINLAADKPAVFREIARVLRPGGRVGVSDIVAADELTPVERAERGGYAECVSGALSFAEYRTGLRAAGLEAVEIVPTHEVGDRMYGAIVRARRPAR